MNENVKKLKRICDSIVKDESLWPKNGLTFCNFAVNLICQHMGYTGFADMVANQIYDKCLKVHTETSAAWAEEYANSGEIAVAAQRADPYGHVAVIYPGDGVFSGKWRTQVPLCANVGITCGVVWVNYAFKTPPKYFAIKP